MDFCVIGLSFQRTSVKQRQLFAFPDSKKLEALLDFSSFFKGDGCVLLSTCNRIEIYTTTLQHDAVLNWWSKFLDQDKSLLREFIYFKKGKNALIHLIEVCAGLDSMVLGENQILGQVKQAYKTSFDCQLVERRLRFFFEEAFKCTKKLKTLTHFSSYQISVASLAASTALKKDQKKNNNYLIIGAGQTGELILKYLHQHRRKQVTIINRTEKKAKNLAEKYAVCYQPFNKLRDLIDQSSIIFIAISRTTPLLEKSDFLSLGKKNKNWHIFDLSVPLNTSLCLNHQKQITITSLDDLKESALINNQKRQKDLKKASLMIKNYLKIVEKRLTLFSYKENITDYLDYCNTLRISSVESALKDLRNGHCPKNILEKLSYQLMKKITHLHLDSLKSSPAEEKIPS